MNTDQEMEEKENQISRKLIDQIQLAFEKTPSPGSSANAISATPADEGVADYFRDTDWRQHSAKNLRRYSCAICFFTDAAFRYFLPAFMIAELAGPDTADIIGESIAYRLTCRDVRDLLHKFTRSELRAVVCFLDECNARYHLDCHQKALAIVKSALQEKEEVRSHPL